MALFFNLCSSSSGNATYIGSRTEGLLFDAGTGIRNFSKWLALQGIHPEAVKGIFVTHEHSDHVKGLKVIADRYHIPIYGSEGTLRRMLNTGRLTGEEDLHVIRRETAIGGFTVVAAPTSHDSPGSVCYRVETPDGGIAGVCTDLGYMSDLILETLSGCGHILIEANYDEQMLETGPYPYYLKERISSPSGHLSNAQCAEAVGRLYREGCRSFSLGHLSEHNNLPHLAEEAVSGYLQFMGLAPGKDFRLEVLPKTTSGKAVEF